MSREFSLIGGKKRAFENVHLVLACIVFVVALITVFTFEKHPYMFSVCFFTAALMEISNAIFCLIRDDKNKRAYGFAVFWGIMSVVLIALGIISLIAGIKV